MRRCLEALSDYHRLERYGFTPPAHRQGRGIDPRVREIMGVEPFRDDLLASSGLDAGMTLPDPADPSLKTIRVMQ